MRDADKDRSAEKAGKRAQADGRCAWRKLGPAGRGELLAWMAGGARGADGVAAVPVSPEVALSLASAADELLGRGVPSADALALDALAELFSAPEWEGETVEHAARIVGVVRPAAACEECAGSGLVETREECAQTPDGLTSWTVGRACPRGCEVGS